MARMPLVDRKACISGNHCADPGRRFRSVTPGRLSYGAAVALQERLLEERRTGDADFLVLLEHSPVVTLGRRGGGDNLLLAESAYPRCGIEVARSNRGGDVTYHGPGQLVGYPIVDLSPLGRDLHAYLRSLEGVLIAVLRAFGIEGERIPGRTGVWVGGAKIASIGVAVRSWIAWHGFALNVGNDLSGFATIVPCGLSGVAMTSLERELGSAVSLEVAAREVIRAFSTIFASVHAGAYDPSDQEETVLA